MKLIVTAIAATALLFGSAGAGLAKNGHGGGKAHFSAKGKAHVGKARVSTRVHTRTSAKAWAPGQRMKAEGRVSGYPGASGYAPGQRMKADGSVAGYPGASGYAPGHLKSTTGERVRVR